MITMILLFLLTCILSLILWVAGKVQEQGMAGIALAGIVLFILTPALSQKIPLTYDKIPYASSMSAEIYYSESENKYYKITDGEYWNIFDLYNVCEISEEEAKTYI